MLYKGDNLMKFDLTDNNGNLIKNSGRVLLCFKDGQPHNTWQIREFLEPMSFSLNFYINYLVTKGFLSKSNSRTYMATKAGLLKCEQILKKYVYEYDGKYNRQKYDMQLFKRLLFLKNKFPSTFLDIINYNIKLIGPNIDSEENLKVISIPINKEEFTIIETPITEIKEDVTNGL